MILGLWLSVALGQDDEDPAADEEIIVYGELRVARAREAVVAELQELGYDAKIIDRGNHVVYRHAAPWHGEVVLYDDGWMQVKRQPLRVEGRKVPWAREGSPLAWAGCLVYPWACLRVNGAFVGQRKWRGTETRVVARTQATVTEWGDRVADLATERTVDGLPDALAALWEHGTPLDGGPALSTYQARRTALVTLWRTRTETVWGAQVRAAIRAFIRGVVQPSDHPFSAAELTAFGLGEQ